MLKKTAVISAAVLAVCLVAFFALSPLAISDSVALAQQAAPSYAVLSEISQYSAENIQVLTLSGRWIDSLEVRPSGDNKIHILTDNYSVTSPVFKPRSSGDGTLRLYCAFEDPSPITLLARDNIQRLIIASLNNTSLNKIILELPASVAFDPGEYNERFYHNLFIDERVTVLDTEEVPSVEVEGFEDSEETNENNYEVSSEVSPTL